MPNVIPPPSKAGPAEQDALSSHSLFPSTISPFVPISMNNDIPFCSVIPDNATPETISPPTYDEIPGIEYMRASRPGIKSQALRTGRGKRRCSRGVGRQHDVFRVYLVKKVHHCCIPGYDNMGNIFDIDLCLDNDVGYQRIYRRHHCVMELRQSPAFTAIHYPRDNVFPVAYLPVIVRR